MNKILLVLSFTLLLANGVALNSNNGMSLAGNESDLPFEHSVVVEA
jgi:hypothetical protein